LRATNNTATAFSFSDQNVDFSDKSYIFKEQKEITDNRYIAALKNLKETWLLEMTNKEFITSYYKNLQKIIPQITNVLYYKDGKKIDLFTFIDDETLKVTRKIYDNLLDLYDKLDNFNFNFLVLPKEYLSDYQNSKMESII
jgi:hypothetical protein